MRRVFKILMRCLLIGAGAKGGWDAKEVEHEYVLFDQPFYVIKRSASWRETSRPIARTVLTRSFATSVIMTCFNVCDEHTYENSD